MMTLFDKQMRLLSMQVAMSTETPSHLPRWHSDLNSSLVKFSELNSGPRKEDLSKLKTLAMALGAVFDKWEQNVKYFRGENNRLFKTFLEAFAKTCGTVFGFRHDAIYKSAQLLSMIAVSKVKIDVNSLKAHYIAMKPDLCKFICDSSMDSSSAGASACSARCIRAAIDSQIRGSAKHGKFGPK